MDYKISVIIPVYNAEKYIRECLDSVVNQTLGIENIEVILVNDCSQDNTINIVNEFVSKYPSIKVINQEKNSGPGPTRNLGLMYATSEYITFLDSDDFISENTYEYCLEKLINDNYDLIIYKYVLYDGKGTEFPLDIHQEIYTKEHIIEDLNEVPEIIFATSTCNKILSKKLLKDIEFPKSLYEDNIVALKILLNSKKTLITRECTYFYRCVEDSITSTFTLTHFFDLLKSIKDVLNLITKYPQYENLFKFYALNFMKVVLLWILGHNFNYTNQRKLDSIIKSLQVFNKEDINKYNDIFPKYKLNKDEMEFISNKMGLFEYLIKNKYDIQKKGSLYINSGNGFIEEEKISLFYVNKLEKSISFDLSSFSNIKSLRFDPIEDSLISCEIKSINSNGENIKLVNTNAYNSVDDEKQLFITTDPYYLFEGNFDNCTFFEIKLILNKLNNLELSNEFQMILDDKDSILKKKEKLIKNIKNSLSWRITIPLRSIKNIFK